MGGGNTPGGNTNVIQYTQIATGGDNADFGDLTRQTNSQGAGSNGHGGL